ncbi:MAG: methyltransferase domain-containing protein [Pseudomonadota bacterium]
MSEAQAGQGAPSTPDWSAARYARDARFVADLATPVLDLLGPVQGLEVLDLGCGDGPMTAALAARGARVTGVDASADMVAATQARGLTAQQADGQALPFEGAFDAVFSNAAIHWMPDQDAVIAGIARALRPGGVLVAEQGGQGNVAAIRTALIAALAEEGIDTTLDEVWAFPSAPAQRARLERHGFTVEHCDLIPRPTRVDAGMEAWLGTLAAPVLARVAPDRREAFITRVTRLVTPALRAEDGTWWADYVRLRYRAILR